MKPWVLALRALCLVSLICGGIGAGCSSNDPDSEAATQSAGDTASIAKDRMALRRIERDPPACEFDRDCITGSHCDAATSRCKWECIADTDCGPAARCTDSGTCTVEAPPGAGRFIARSATDSKGCSLLPPAELIRVLTTLNDDEVTCAHGDADCACGSYCNGLTGLCEVDCIAGVNNLPVSIPGCGTGKVCTSLGRCAASSSTPPPPIHALTLQVSPVVISGNPASGPVLVPATVSVIANSLDFLKPTQPATVRYRILPQPVAPPAPGTIPQVKCAPDASLADHCDLTGWSFHVDTGSLVSDPRTIWVQLPQAASAAEWTLEARSDWSLNPEIAVVSADPVAFPTTDPGHYTGTMTWDNHGATGTIGRLTVPIEAFVSATNVALYEPTRIVLPDGHAVFSRDATKVTMVGWLASGTSRYDVKLGLAVGAYNSVTGHLDATGSYQTGSLRQTPITLSLQRTGDTGVASCPTSGSCATGSYCDAVMNLCLPGTGAAAGAGIVAATAVTPTTTLPSSLLAAWNASLTTVQNSSPLLSGSTLRERFDRPYCFQSSAQAAPATFALGTTLLAPSNDLACNIGGGEQSQKTFPFENLQQELGQDGNGNAFNLTTDCASELDVQPSTSLPGLNKCVSLPRFLMALRADQVDDVGYRLKTQLLRQWLGVNAYIASTTVQNQPYEAALGVSGQPPAARMAQALDRMDRDLAVLLDPSARTYYAPDNGSAMRVGSLPDYRPKSRPVVRWTFNTPSSSIANAETATSGPATLTCNPMFLANARLERTWGAGQDFQACQAVMNGPATVTPRTGGPSWTVVAAVEMTKPTWFTFFQEGVLRDLLGNGQLSFLSSKVFSAGRFTDILNVTHWAVRLQNSDPIFFGAPGVAFPDIQVDSTGTKLGLLAFVANNGQYTLMQALPGQAVRVYTGTPYGVGDLLGGIIPWVDTGNFDTVQVGQLTINDGSKSSVDEISLWNRALTVDEFALMASRYNFTPTNDSLPPVSQEQPLAGEQAVGLPVHLIETASADLKLLGAYVEADKNLVYSQCLSGQHAELDAMFDRVGRGLRTISILQDEAASIVAAVGTSTPWYLRYQADLTELAGRRAKLISNLVALQGSECRNPLGISEGDLPLYVGSTGNSAAERFFAGSRFLANAALGEISAAGGESGVDGLLAQARSAYNAARISKFQETQGAHDSADRILRISVDYETQLKRYCGAPANEDVAHGVFPLVAGFQSGAYTTANCFLKSELPECVGLGNTPLEKLPSHCLRGEMGERVLAIQAAIVDSDNASKAYDRAQSQFDAAMAYCGRLKIQLDGDLELLKKHQAHMRQIVLEKETVVGSRWSKIKAYGSAVLSGGFFGVTSKIAAQFGGFEQREIDEQNAYNAEKLARGNATEIMACTQKADDQKFAIDAAKDTIDRAFEQSRAAGIAFDDAANLVASFAAEGAGQLAIEQQIDRTPPHLHYWLDQSISAYHAHMAYARRLTYLAVRAYEYESQSSSSLRGDVLNAVLPNDLKTVASTILGATAPIAGRRIDQGPLVLSLRDDVLHLVDLSTNSSRVDGTAPLKPVEAFKQLLKSNATRVYDKAGRYVGHGIRFSLRPEAVDAQTCAERISRIMPSVTLANASQEITHTRLILAATNTFGSQQCGPVVPGPLLFARVQPSQALLVGDAVPTFPDPSPFSTTGLFPLFNTARDALRNMTFPADDTSAFAGRGRYGDYILIFPDDPKACTPSLCDGWSEDALDNVDDVLLRFDFVEQDNTHL